MEHTVNPPHRVAPAKLKVRMLTAEERLRKSGFKYVSYMDTVKVTQAWTPPKQPGFKVVHYHQPPKKRGWFLNFFW